MKPFYSTDTGKQTLSDLLEAQRKYILEEIEKIDPDIVNLKSRPYKWLCGFWFGHLPDNFTHICKRCHKQLK